MCTQIWLGNLKEGGLFIQPRCGCSKNNEKFLTEVCHQNSLLNWHRTQCSGVDESVATVAVSGTG